MHLREVWWTLGPGWGKDQASKWTPGTGGGGEKIKKRILTSGSTGYHKGSRLERGVNGEGGKGPEVWGAGKLEGRGQGSLAHKKLGGPSISKDGKKLSTWG